MKKDKVYKHYKKLNGGKDRGTWALIALRLGITRQRINGWEDIIPEAMAYRIQSDTDGALKADPKVYRLEK